MSEYSHDRLVIVPDDIDLTRSPLRSTLTADTFVLGAFNPGMTRLSNGNLLLMVRIAEALSAPVKGDRIHAIRWEAGRYVLDDWPLDAVDTSDPRKFMLKGQGWNVMALTSLSWLLPVELSPDGLNVIAWHYDRAIAPAADSQCYGVEDARISCIDGRYWMYDAVIGWDIAPRDVGEGDMDYRMIRPSDGGMAGGVLALSQEMQDGGALPAWYGYVHVADVDAAKQTFVAAGGTVHFDQTIDGVGRMAFVTDAQGAPLYIMTPNPTEGDPDAKSDVFDYEKAQHVRWNELSTTDLDGAIAFYTGLFSWRQEGTMPMGELGDYKLLYRGEVMIGAVMAKPPGMPRSKRVYSIGVDDIDRATAAVSDGGGALIAGPHQIPGGEYSAVCTDPHGVAFGLVGPRKE